MLSALQPLLSYVPWQVVEYLDETSALATRPFLRRFTGSILFVDISGFTSIAERLVQGGKNGVEELSRLLNVYFGELINLIDSHGGTVTRFAGDAVLAVWPAGDLSAATRSAVRCGFALQRKLNRYLAGEETLFLKVNVEAGDLLFANIGGSYGHWALMAAGEPFEKVIKGQEGIQPGVVVMSRETFLLAGEQYSSMKIGGAFVQLVPQDFDHTSTPDPPIPEDLTEESLRAYIPPPVLSRLDAQQSDWLAELRRVTVLYLSIFGIQYESERVLDDLQMVMRITQKALADHGGTLLQIGVDDKGTTMVLAFGLPPQIHADDPLRGLHAAQTIQAGLSDQNLNSAIGVTTGRLFCGPVGNAIRKEYTLYGNEVNVASRLAQSCRRDADTILTDESTYEAAKSHVELQELPPFELRGKHALETVYRVVDARQSTADTLPLLGREAERAILGRSLTTLQHERRSTVVLIEGEPGIGKSRLVEDFLQRATDAGVDCVTSQTDAAEQSPPYQAWRSIFAQLLGIEAKPGSKSLIPPRLRDDPSLERLAPLINSVVPLELLDNDFTSQLTGEVRAENLNTLLLGILRQRLRESSLVIVLEDVHWMDSASWSLALRVARDVGPIILILTLNPFGAQSPQDYQQLLADPKTQRLALSLLDPHDCRSLIARRLGVESISDDLLDTFNRTAEGNPFFIDQLCQAMRDRQMLVVSDGIVHLRSDRAPLKQIEIPESIQAIIASRIDQLQPTQQLILKVASCSGQTFRFDTIRDCYPLAIDLPRLEADLTALERFGVIHRDKSPLLREYSFTHALIQQSVYDMMLSEQKQSLHRRIATWYEDTQAQDVPHRYQLLSHHWLEADAKDKAAFYFRMAGEQALSTFANEEARLFLEHALALEMFDDTDADAKRRGRLELKLGETYVNLGNYVDGRTHLERGLALLGEAIPNATVSQLIGLVLEAGRQGCHRGFSKRFGSRRLHLNEDVETVCRAYGRLFEASYFGNDILVCMYSAVRLLNLAETAGSAAMITIGSSLLGAIFGYIPIRKAAEGYLNRGRLEAKKVVDIDARLLNLIGIGYYYAGVGQWTTSTAAFEEVVKISEQYSHRRRLADGLSSLLYLSLLRSDFHRAQRLVDNLTNAVVGLNDLRYEVANLAGQGYRCIFSAEFERAREYLESAASLFAIHPEMGDEDAKTEIYGLLAITHLRLSNLEKALEFAERAASRTSTSGPSNYQTFPGYVGPAEVYLSLWEKDSSFEKLKPLAVSACKRLRSYSQKFPIGRPRMLLARGRYFWLIDKHSRAMEAWQRCISEAEQRAMPGERGLAHYEIGRHLANGAAQRSNHLEIAASLFEKCGEVFYQAIVDELRLTSRGLE
jgi:class 3 adenylate cyclase/tetratricopeptide (TPR) repeat protein